MTFVGLTCALIAVPLLPLIGTPVLWGLLPFMIVAISGLWIGLRRSTRDGDIHEELTLWSDRVQLQRRDPKGQVREWDANPYWVTVTKHETGGPVPNYVTLSGSGREVEIGAFLSEDERLGLFEELDRMLRRIARP